jgi:hypothetical protein
MAEVIRLMKKEMKKNAFVINIDSIHKMLETYPKINRAINKDGNTFYLDSVEMGHFGNQANINDVVAFEEVSRSENCPFGFNLWCMGNIEKASQRVTIKSDTEIYTKAVIDEAIFFDNENDVLEFIKARTSTEFFSEKVHVSGTDILINTKYGDAKGKIGQCYVISHGTDRIQILTLGTPSVEDFCVVDKDDKVIAELKDLH